MKLNLNRFGDFATFKYGKMPDKKKIRSSGPYPIYSGYRYVGYCNEYNTEANQLIIVARGVGGTGDVKLTAEKCYVTNLSIIVSINSQIALQDYLYYYFMQKNLRYLDSGSAQSQITISDLENVTIPLPKLDEQKKICLYLSLFDNIIKINKKINNNLEQQAQALYQHMFIDSPCTEWRESSLSDIAEVSSGRRPPMKSTVRTNETAFPIVGAADVMGFTNSFNHNEKILIIGRVGTHGIVQRFNSPCWTSDNTLVITSNYYEYVYQILKRIDYHSLNRGSTQPLITQSDINKVPVLLPDNDALIEYETLAGTLMSEHEAKVIENTKLSEIRDTLLPRLMSGEIDVSDIDI